METRPEDVERGGLAPEEEVYPPPDEPGAADGRTTATEHRAGERLGEKLAQERSEAPEKAPRVAPADLVDQGMVDQEKDQIADEAGDDGLGPEPAEEAAIRIQEEEDAPGLTEGPDRYVEES